MAKRFMFLLLFTALCISVFAYTGPNVKFPFVQNDWSGGDGQVLSGDPTKYYESAGIITEFSPITLDYIEDTNFTLLNTYPPSTIPALLKVNGLVNHNDTIYGLGGMPARLAFTANAGATWVTYDTLPINQAISEILDIEIIDGVKYASGFYGGMNMGFVCKSLSGLSWSSTNDQPLGADRVYDILHVGGDTFLISAGNPDLGSTDMDGSVFKSVDNCETWESADTIAYAVVTKLLRISNDTIIAIGDNILYGSPIMISENGGDDWAPLLPPDSLLNLDVYALNTVEQINGYMYVGDLTGNLSRTDDFGTVWEALDVTNTIPDTSEITGIYSFEDSTIYVTATYPGALYKSVDGGFNFVLNDNITDLKTAGMVKLAPHTYAVGSTNSTEGGKIFIDSYYKSGHIVSSAYNVDLYDSVLVSDYYDFYAIKADSNLLRNTTITVKARTSADSLMSDAPDWTVCPAIKYGIALTDTYSLGNYSSITNGAGECYIQYRIDFTNTAREVTPSIDSVYMLKIKAVDELTSIKAVASISIEEISNLKYLVTSSSNTGSVKVFDLSGRIVKSTNITNGKAMLNMTNPSGRYIVRIYDSKDEVLGSKNINIIK